MAELDEQQNQKKGKQTIQAATPILNSEIHLQAPIQTTKTSLQKLAPERIDAKIYNHKLKNPSVQPKGGKPFEKTACEPQDSAR